MNPLNEEHYLTEDRILPSLLRGEESVEIRIDVTEEYVSLTVGLRDWQWKRGCPDTCGSGTSLIGLGIPFDPDSLPTSIPEDGQ